MGVEGEEGTSEGVEELGDRAVQLRGGRKAGRGGELAHLEADGLCVAAPLGVEDSLVVPAVLVVSDEGPLGVGRERGLAGACACAFKSRSLVGFSSWGVRRGEKAAVRVGKGRV